MEQIKYESKETKYNNILFKSRLEARWAMFLDLCNIKWTYEPVKFDGWIPDFVFYSGNEKIHVEVKPLDWGHRTEWKKKLFKEVHDDMIRSGQKNCILLGDKPLFSKKTNTIGLGWIFSPYNMFSDAFKLNGRVSYFENLWEISGENLLKYPTEKIRINRKIGR